MALGVLPGGQRVFVAGWSIDPVTSYDFATVAYDPKTGEQAWASRYDGGSPRMGSSAWTARSSTSRGSVADLPEALAVSPDGSQLFVTGSSSPGQIHPYFTTVAYRATTGGQGWVAEFKGPADSDVPHAIGVSQDGSRVFVTGESSSPDSGLDFLTIAYGTVTGVKIWEARHTSQGFESESATALGVSSDGSRVFLTGTGFTTVALDALTGQELWASQPIEERIKEAAALAVSPDGRRVFVTGEAWSDRREAYGYFTVAFDAGSGAELWSARYDGFGEGNGRLGDKAHALGMDPLGSRVYVTGESYGKRPDYATIAYDTVNGNQLWLTRYDGPGNSWDYARALAVNSKGDRVVVSGVSNTQFTLDDYVTVIHDAATGQRLDVLRYGGAGSGTDSATAIGVLPDGSTVFVTGESSRDFATVAYGLS